MQLTQSTPTLFTFGAAKIRAITLNGEPWFVAKDVCEILGLGNHSQAISKLDDDERGVISNDPLKKASALACVSESGLYALVLGSRKKEAKDFRRWITKEVVPSIRKTGSYAARKETRVQRAARELEEARIAEASENVLKVIAPKDNYGEIASNGLPKLSVRAGAFYASRRGALLEAAEINRQLRQLDEHYALREHPELALGL